MTDPAPRHPDVARHDRPRATPRAPGADVPPATTAEAPGQYCLSAAHRASDHFRSRPAPRAPGHDRPLAASSDVARHDRPRAILRAPGADVPLASTAGVPGQHRLRAVAYATVALPAGPHRLRQECLPRVPANPRTLTHLRSHLNTAHSHCLNRLSRESGNPRSPLLPLLQMLERGPGVRSTSLQAHPAIQVPPYPRSYSAAHTGFLSQRHPRAPPRPPAENLSLPADGLPLFPRERAGVRAAAPLHAI